jgi:hypothetical protein
VRLRLPPRPPVDYQVRRSNYAWADHVLRVQLTGALISWFCPDTVLDPACGDGSIIMSANRARPISAARLADISKPNCDYIESMEAASYLPAKYSVVCQSVEETLSEDRFYDMIVLTEILEHVEDPVHLMKLARAHAKIVVASSPLIPDDGTMDDNPEHLWQFDIHGYGEMLEESGWHPITCLPVSLTPPQFIYDFQIWGAT